MIEFPSQTAPDTVSGSQLRLGGSKRCEGRPAVILRDFFFRLLGGDPRIPHEPPLSGCRKMPVTRRIATLTNATGFCNAISVLILRREPSPLPVAKPTGFTTVALTALACKIAPICLIPFLAMIVRGRIELRLDSALNPGDPADEITAKALEDTTRADNIGREGYEKALRDYQTRRAQE